MDDELLLAGNGSWHRGQRKRVAFQSACYYTHEPELPFGCQYSASQSDAWRQDPTRAMERQVLLELYAMTGGGEGKWRADENWGQDSDPCWDSWYGVTCDEHGHVIALELPDNGLEGPLPPDLGQLTALLKLDLSTSAPSYHHHDNMYANRLYGPLPSFVTATRIEEIEVSGNQLTDFPSDLYLNGATLRSLSASHNMFTSLPRFLRRYKKLHTLELDHNNIQDDFPSIELGSMDNARFVHLQYNNLGGSIAPAILGMKRVRVLDLSHNPRLAGQLPVEILVQWTETDYLSILNTSVTGYLSSLCSDVPFCWKFMYDTHKDMTWATASDVPQIVYDTLALARTGR